MSRKATLIVLAWNRWDLTKRCLESLLETNLADADVMVVDNGSTDETPQALAKYRSVRVISNSSNLGYVRGNNAGIRAADPDSDIVLLNNDLEFHQNDWLTRLRNCAHSFPDIGVVGCRLQLPDGRLLHAGTFIRADTMWGQQIGAEERDIGQFSADREVEGIVFACAYLKREVMNAIGPLSEDFVSYFEDTDYCLRAQKAGFRVFLCGGVTLVHNEHGSTHLDAPEFERIFNASRETFNAKWRAALEGQYQYQLLWQSIMNFPTGYAMSCREILRSLDRESIRVVYRYVYGPKTPFNLVEPESSGDYLMNVIRARELAGFPAVGVVYGQGNVFYQNRARLKIGFTMLEVDGFPKEWVRQANNMDEVWVPTEFNRVGFLTSGLKRPVHKIPLGIDSNYFHPGIRGFPNPLGEFVFLASFEWGERKDPGSLLKVFNETFKSTEPVRLVCKIINRDPAVHVSQEIRKLDLSQKGGKISFLLNKEFPYYQLAALYRSADCYISAGRGEGWDMPLMEAMACGLPAIATDWGAHQEFVHEGNAYPLAVRGTIPAVAKCPYYEGFSWADPDLDHLRYLLREVYEKREDAARRGRRAAEEIAAKWTWKQSAKRIIERIGALTS
jgi:GT2 family glycosyltransferase